MRDGSQRVRAAAWTKQIVCVVGVGVTSSFAGADIEQHDVDYQWDVNQGNEPAILTVPLFDTMGGARELTGVRVGLEGSMTLDMYAENQEPFAVGEGEWFVESGLFMQLEFSTLNLGVITGVGLGLFSADLAASDGVKGAGDDFTSWSYDRDLGAQVDILEQDLGAFIGEGSMATSLYPFLSLGVSPPPPTVFSGVAGHEHGGTLQLTYEYVNVPAPGAAMLAGTALTMGGLRRRR